MAIKRTVKEVDAGTDARMEVLGALADSNGCQGWAFLQVDLSEGAMDLKLEVGGIVQDTDDARALLERALEALS